MTDIEKAKAMIVPIHLFMEILDDINEKNLKYACVRAFLDMLADDPHNKAILLASISDFCDAQISDLKKR